MLNYWIRKWQQNRFKNLTKTSLLEFSKLIEQYAVDVSYFSKTLFCGDVSIDYEQNIVSYTNKTHCVAKAFCDGMYHNN